MNAKDKKASSLEAAQTRYAIFRPAWSAFAVYFLGAAIFLTGPQVNPQAFIGPKLGLLLGLAFLAFIFIKRYSVQYKVDLSEITVTSALPWGSDSQAVIKEITRIDLRRSLVHRLLDVAHIHIYINGQDSPQVRLFGVPEPFELKNLLLDRGARDQIVTGAWRN